jgi:hypothetical protein
MAPTDLTSKEIVERINSYLASGGLWTPDLANHEAVRDMLIDIRDALHQSSHEPRAERGFEAVRLLRMWLDYSNDANDPRCAPHPHEQTEAFFAASAPPPPPEHPLSSGDAIACIGMALQNPDTDEWPQLLRDCMHVIERMEGELLDAKRQRNDESRLRQAAERAGAQYTLRGWISPNPGCAELADHDGGGWEPVYSRSTKEAG